jgi:hypothetical protein
MSFCHYKPICIVFVSATFFFTVANVRAVPPATKVIVLGVDHSAQLVAESYQPSVFRAFFDRVKPDAICIERSPQEFARNDSYEFTYEQQYLTVPYARLHKIPLYPIDWLPAAEDTLLAFNLPDLDRPLFIRRPTGFLGFQDFTSRSVLKLDFFFSETETDRNEHRKFAVDRPPKMSFDFARRLFLYRTFMQAKRIQKVAAANQGKTVLVVIGATHKTDIEEILIGENGIEIAQPSSFGRPAEDAVESETRPEDLFAIATFNLLGVQSKTKNVKWDWMGRILDRLESAGTAETKLLRTRYEVLNQQLSSQKALVIYEELYKVVGADSQLTWSGVKDKSRVDSYFDPFGNLSVKQRIQLEIARENSKLGRFAVVTTIKKNLESELTPSKAQQLEAYWKDFLVGTP